MPTIKFVNEKKEIQVPDGANLRNEAYKAGVQVYKRPGQNAALPGLGLLRHLPRADHQGNGKCQPDGLRASGSA